MAPSLHPDDMPITLIDPHNPDLAILKKAADLIRSGGLVAFPTETVYGIAVDAANGDAIRRLYTVKGRPEGKPILLLIAERAWLTGLTDSVSQQAEAVMAAFWPGPLTLAFSASSTVHPGLLAGGTTIGVRFSDSKLAQALAHAVGGPITAPSANRSGAENPLSAQEVHHQFGDQIDLILDGGSAQDAVPSTVVDVSGKTPLLIRPGKIPFEAVFRVWTHADCSP